MDDAAVYILLYLAQIALCVVLAVTNPFPKKGSSKLKKAWRIMVFIGLLPCLGYGIVVQLVALGYYRYTKSKEDAHVASPLPTSFGNEQQPRPRQPPPPSQGSPRSSDSSDNPFL